MLRGPHARIFTRAMRVAAPLGFACLLLWAALPPDALHRQSMERWRWLRRRGAGGEFASLREYGPDDSFRAIDWKASARRGKAMGATS